MKLEWQRLITLPYDAHAPWLMFGNIEQQTLILHIVAALGWFCVGVFQTLKQDGSSRASGLKALLLGALLASCFTFTQGNQIFEILSIGAGLPWLILLTTAKSHSTLRVIFILLGLTIVSIFTALSSSIFALLVVACLIIMNGLINNSKSVFSQAKLIIMLLPALLIYAISPTLEWPILPANARLISDDGLPGIIRPLLGSAKPFPLLSHASLASSLTGLAYSLLGVLVLLFVLNYKNRSQAKQYLAFAILLICFYADIFLPAAWREIAPLQSLARIVPGWFEQALSLAIATVLLASALAMISKNVIKLHFQILCLAILLLPLGPSISTSAHIWSLKNQDWAKNVATNPVARKFNCLGSSKFKTLASQYSFLPAKEFVEKIEFSRPVPDRQVPRVLDSKPRSRWSSKSFGQKGTEWIKINFKENLNLNAIELDPGKFKSDFPRALEVVDCSQTKTQTIFIDHDWQGSMQFTAEEIPYFSHQGDVKIPLHCKKTAPAISCLMIKQIGFDQTFDWSIAEIRLSLDEQV